jgi:hypothetical protein
LPLAHTFHESCASSIDSVDKPTGDVKMVSLEHACELHHILTSCGERKLTGHALRLRLLHERRQESRRCLPCVA